MPHRRVVVVVVVTAEDAHHVAREAHGGKHASVDLRAADFLPAGAAQDGALAAGGLGILGHGNVHEGQCRHRAPVLRLPSLTLMFIPRHLLRSEPGIAAHVLYLRVVVRVEAVDQRFDLVACMAEDGQRVVRRDALVHLRCYAVGRAGDERIELLHGHASFAVVVAKGHHEGYAMGGDVVEDHLQRRVGGL